jgi:hypothetical protein
MSDKANELSGSSAFVATDFPLSNRPTWRRDGTFIVDGTGKRVAQMYGEPAEYEWPQRRIIAALNALHDTPTHFVEQLLEEADGNVIETLVARDRQMAATLQNLEKKIAAHCREIEQLREMMDACRVFEEHRAHLYQAPGASEYEGLLRMLGIRQAGN